MIFFSARSGQRVLCLCSLAASLVLTVRPFQAAEPDHPGNLPSQTIGANDLLSIVVYGAPELTRTVRVGTDGQIRMPMLMEPITAEGRMPAELENVLTQALAQRKILVDPVVTVSVSEYHSHPISVAGAVKAPVTFQAMGKTTLLEALTRAQGLTPEAGPEILVSRPAKPGSLDAGTPVPVERVPVKGLIEEANPAWNLPLEGGEEIRVPQVGRVFVVGNVKRPGGFRVEDGGEMTVLKALALAEGLSPFSAKVAYIFRRGETKNQEVAVELRKIMDRKASDVLLGPNDIFYVPDNRSRRNTIGAVERAIGFATATASGALILSVR
ncbi:MAG: polysaccharide biosynthesis/export family protein [Bryobacteraceae bacterium]